MLFIVKCVDLFAFVNKKGIKKNCYCQPRFHVQAIFSQIKKYANTCESYYFTIAIKRSLSHNLSSDIFHIFSP